MLVSHLNIPKNPPFLPEEDSDAEPAALGGAGQTANRPLFHAGQRSSTGTPRRANSMWFPQPVHEGFPQLRQVIREHMFLAEWPTGKKSFGFWTGVFMVAVVVVAVNGEQRRKY